MSGLEVRGIVFQYGKSPVLQGAGFRVKRGELCVLLGANGAGKSTLLKCVNGLLRPRSGTVAWEGQDTGRLSLKKRAQIYGYVPQGIRSDSGLTVMETVLSGRLPRTGMKAGKADVLEAERLVDEFDLNAFAFRPLGALSGGERQRVLIARAMAGQPEALLLDEPTSNLDLRYQYEVMELLARIGREKRMAVAAVIHDLNLALDFAGWAAVIHEGRTAAEGKPGDVIVPELIEQAYGISAQIGTCGGRRVVLPRLRR